MSETNLSDTPTLPTVPFGEKLVASGAFKALFREGMTLVEDTAAYLDGPGRQESKDLPRASALAYATESMRLTTRLMQLASWLLLQRAVNEGELTTEQANEEKNKVRLTNLAPAPDDYSQAVLPERLVELIQASLRLQARIRHLDEASRRAPETAPPPAINPVSSQLETLRAAFQPRA